MPIDEQIDEAYIDAIAQYALLNGTEKKLGDPEYINSGKGGADAFHKSVGERKNLVVEVDGYKILVKDENVKWNGGTRVVYWSDKNNRSLKIFSKDYESGKFPIVTAYKTLSGKSGRGDDFSNKEEPIEPTPWEIHGPVDKSYDSTKAIEELYGKITLPPNMDLIFS
jgi:hypothetical protein